VNTGIISLFSQWPFHQNPILCALHNYHYCLHKSYSRKKGKDKTRFLNETMLMYMEWKDGIMHHAVLVHLTQLH